MHSSTVLLALSAPASLAGRIIFTYHAWANNATNTSLIGMPTNTTTGFGFRTIPYTELTAFTSPVWTTLPLPQLETAAPFCVNEADPDQGVGNYCVCQNGATVAVIPITGQNLSSYQPCAYTTVGASSNFTTLAPATVTATATPTSLNFTTV